MNGPEAKLIQSCVPDKDVLDKLGKGAYGIVYKVVESGKQYALKTYVNDAFAPSNLIEIDTLVRMDHPNVVKTHKAYVNKQCGVCLLLDLADSDLDKYIKDHSEQAGTATPEKQRIMFGLACGLNYLHSNFIIHKDLKPPNVLLKNGVPLIADFGLASIRLSEEIKKEGPVNTIWWRPPEMLVIDLEEDQNAPHTISGKVDVWAMGLIFYQLIMGVMLVSCQNECSQDLLYKISRRIEAIPQSQISVINPVTPVKQSLFAGTSGDISMYKTVRSLLEFYHTPQGKEFTKMGNDQFFTPIGPPWRGLIRKMLRTDPAERISAKDLVALAAFGPVSTPVGCAKGKMQSRPFTINPSKGWMKKRSKILKTLYKEVYANRSAFFLAVDILDRFFTKVEKATSTDNINLIANAAWYIAACFYETGEYMLHPTGLEPADYAAVCEIVTILGFNLFRPTIDLQIPMRDVSRTAVALCYISTVSPDEIKECTTSSKGIYQEAAFKLDRYIKAYFKATPKQKLLNADTVANHLIELNTGLEMNRVVDASSKPAKLRKRLDKFLEETKNLASTKEYLRLAPRP